MTRKQVIYIVVGGMGAFVLLVLLGVAYGPLTKPSVSPLGQRSGLPQGRPGQGIAEANPLHRAHVRSAIKCTICHEAEGAAANPTRHRCLRCHGDRTANAHQGLADETARECLLCHDFLHLPKAALTLWGCPSCHVGTQAGDSPTRAPDGPRIRIHGGELCSSCHRPHGADAVVPRACTDCHAAQATEHAASTAPGAAGCLGCHRAHRPASEQKAACLDCHAQRVAEVNALFEGHDSCLGCHPPHGFSKATAKQCGECHADRVATGASKRHRDCTDCHAPHAPLVHLRNSCARCHRDQQTSHPREGANACSTCHRVHQGKGSAAVTTVACSSCHRNARSDTAYHAGARCADCHQPHGRLTGDGNSPFCLECHHKPVGRRPAVAPSRGHSQCRKCHYRNMHDTSRKPPDCSLCHKREPRETIEGHRDCRACHDVHSGKMRSGGECTRCHSRMKIAEHNKSGYANCVACHRPHDGRTEQP